MAVLDFRAEIKKLEDKKWDILLRHGQHVAAARWVEIDERLTRLYGWWVNQLYSQGRERELPFHLRKLL